MGSSQRLDGNMEKKRSPILVEFARKVRLRRHELNLTQEELAERANFHVNYIGGIERALKNPSLESIVALAKALEISPRDLLPDQ